MVDVKSVPVVVPCWFASFEFFWYLNYGLLPECCKLLVFVLNAMAGALPFNSKKAKFVPCFDKASHDTRGNPQSKPSAGEKKTKISPTKPQTRSQPPPRTRTDRDTGAIASEATTKDRSPPRVRFRSWRGRGKRGTHQMERRLTKLAKAKARGRRRGGSCRLRPRR